MRTTAFHNIVYLNYPVIHFSCLKAFSVYCNLSKRAMQKPDALPVVPTFSLRETFYLIKTENGSKNFLTAPILLFWVKVLFLPKILIFCKKMPKGVLVLKGIFHFLDFLFCFSKYSYSHVVTGNLCLLVLLLKNDLIVLLRRTGNFEYDLTLHFCKYFNTGNVSPPRRYCNLTSLWKFDFALNTSEVRPLAYIILEKLMLNGRKKTSNDTTE